jgi:amino-acid N-acetyltransferase
MNKAAFHNNLITPSDLPGILRYVRLFRRQRFFIGIDEALIQTDIFSSILKEIEVLDSLNIRICLFFYQFTQRKFFFINPKHSFALSNLHDSLDISELLLSEADSSRTDLAKNIKQSFDQQSICIIRPEDSSIDFKSHSTFKELCQSTQIDKLIFLSNNECPIINDEPLTNISASELKDHLLKESADQLPDWFTDYSQLAIQAIDLKIERVHLLNCNIHNALLNELFDKVGIGTMIHSNKYEIIREANINDVQALHNLTKNAVKRDTLLNRSLDVIQEKIADYCVYEIDGSIVACTCIHYFKENLSVEIGSVFVQPYYNGRGIGRKLVNDACEKAYKKGYRSAFVLTVDASKFFQSKCGFIQADFHELPEERQLKYKENKRNSFVLKKELV